jgi:uncharacterized protein (DUF488 family)
LIYTTYFAKLKSLPKEIIPISICRKAPAGYKGLQYKKLAPKYDFFMEWKRTGDNDYYIKCFKEQVLDKLNADDVVFELNDIIYYIKGLDMDIALVCYEKPTDFCHRHLVADWLRDNGYRCEEYNYNT